MISLNDEQKRAVEHVGNVVVTACPGSGKTRVLTARVIRGLGELQSPKGRIVALTFTNRAADEIQTRLDYENVPMSQLWAGTIHSFALEWILRPYAPYCGRLRHGFSVADEFYSERIIAKLIGEAGLSPFTDICTGFDRSGAGLNHDAESNRVFRKYKRLLADAKLIDYDDILFLAYKILRARPEAAQILASIVRLICLDEVQDTQDLHFGILSAIVRAASTPPELFFVGDANQSIYDSLGAVTMSHEEIAVEFGLESIDHLELHGNYRSTQRIINLYRKFRADVPPITSLTEYAAERGVISFENQTVSRGELAEAIATLISSALDSGVPPKEICVLAPHWRHVRSIARRLVNCLPHVEFDAPGLSPLQSSRDNVWFKIARLFLTSPSPSRARTRMRWAKEALADLASLEGSPDLEQALSARKFLRIVNSISSSEDEGLGYLRDVFNQLATSIGIDAVGNPALNSAYETFFAKAEDRLASQEADLPRDIASFRRLFSHPSGVVVSTCHGVKGEEYDTVIAFGMLRGYVPHWSAIIDQPEEFGMERESKLLYVICSRAKRRLHLISESGHFTRRGNAYETSNLLMGLRFRFDQIR
jgi:superfamily I DNA/RNA helicase